MDDYLDSNRSMWDEYAEHHVESSFYDVAGFKSGRNILYKTELEEIGSEVPGKSLLHLQCHFGLDTLSWAQMGASPVIGVDFSPQAVAAARRLSQETGIPATFVQSDIAGLTEHLTGEFDVVYTSYGVLCWLPDLAPWGKTIGHFLKPGGFFYIVEFHPFSYVFNNDEGISSLEIKYPYFHNPEPLRFDTGGSYAAPDATIQTKNSYEWVHSLGDIVNTLISAGLRIEWLHEFPFSVCSLLPCMEEFEPRYYRLTEHGQSIPLMFSIKASKP
nr:class I SAM-dependent methyltransferase [Anaerolineae bacterium]